MTPFIAAACRAAPLLAELPSKHVHSPPAPHRILFVLRRAREGAALRTNSDCAEMELGTVSI
jgi:hypothetical protein